MKGATRGKSVKERSNHGVAAIAYPINQTNSRYRSNKRNRAGGSEGACRLKGVATGAACDPNVPRRVYLGPWKMGVVRQCAGNENAVTSRSQSRGLVFVSEWVNKGMKRK